MATMQYDSRVDWNRRGTWWTEDKKRCKKLAEVFRPYSASSKWLAQHPRSVSEPLSSFAEAVTDLKLFSALLSVYDKAGLLPFAEGLAKAGVRLLGSGGTAKAIRNAGMEIG